MFKKTIALLFAFIHIFLVSGCNELGVSDALNLDESEYIQLKSIDYEHFEYNGNVYYLSPMDFLRNETGNFSFSDKCKYLGWTGDRLAYNYLYVDSFDNPTFIYFTVSNNIYFKEDYDYQTDTFLIDGTNDTIRFCDDLLAIDYDISPFGLSTKPLVISSVECPALTETLDVLIFDGALYVCTQTNTTVAFEISEKFTNILLDNKIVKKQDDGSFSYIDEK